MSQLLPYVDVCIANEEDAKDVFGIEAEGTDVNSGKLNRDGYISVARQLSSRFGCKYVAITLRSSISANDNDWAGMLYEAAADKAYFSTTYHVHIVDRVGGGDSFGGGLIYSMLSGYAAQQTLDFAVAASCLKHSIEQDISHVTVAEVAAQRRDRQAVIHHALQKFAACFCVHILGRHFASCCVNLNAGRADCNSFIESRERIGAEAVHQNADRKGIHKQFPFLMHREFSPA